MTAFVLDASALTALAKSETGREKVAQAILAGAAATTVNVGEAAAVLLRQGWTVQETRDWVFNGAWTVVEVDVDLAFRSAELWALTRAAGLSLGDRLCLALAEREDCPALTTDRQWTKVDIGIVVELIR